MAPKMLYLNTHIRGYPKGLRAGSDPRKPLMAIDEGFEKFEFRGIKYPIEAMEVSDIDVAIVDPCGHARFSVAGVGMRRSSEPGDAVGNQNVAIQRSGAAAPSQTLRRRLDGPSGQISPGAGRATAIQQFGQLIKLPSYYYVYVFHAFTYVR